MTEVKNSNKVTLTLDLFYEQQVSISVSSDMKISDFRDLIARNFAITGDRKDRMRLHNEFGDLTTFVPLETRHATLSDYKLGSLKKPSVIFVVNSWEKPKFVAQIEKGVIECKDMPVYDFSKLKKIVVDYRQLKWFDGLDMVAHEIWRSYGYKRDKMPTNLIYFLGVCFAMLTMNPNPYDQVEGDSRYVGRNYSRAESLFKVCEKRNPPDALAKSMYKIWLNMIFKARHQNIVNTWFRPHEILGNWISDIRCNETDAMIERAKELGCDVSDYNIEALRG